PDHTAAPAVLSAIGRERHAFHVVAAGDGDDDVLVGDELLGGELSRRVVDDLGTAGVAIRGRDLAEVLLDEAEDPAGAREARLGLGDELDRPADVGVELPALAPGEPR